jgi:antitoxin HigA-1
MIPNRITTHPGEILREEFMKPYGLSANALAKALHTDAPRVNDIVRERRGVSADMALRLARFFGTSPELWFNLQKSYDLSMAMAERMEQIEREITPIDHAV